VGFVNSKTRVVGKLPKGAKYGWEKLPAGGVLIITAGKVSVGVPDAAK
jgi:hypothetical protein